MTPGRRVRVGVVAAFSTGTLGAVLVGCAPSDADIRSARSAMSNYAKARSRGITNAMCSDMTKHLKRLYSRDAQSCQAGAAYAIKAIGPFRPPFSISVDKSRSSDERIVAVLEYRGLETRSGFEIDLKHERGRWLIDQDDSCLDPC